MDNYNKESSTFGSKKANVGEAASELLNESKKYAHEIYEDGMHKVTEAQQTAKEYTDEMLIKVQKNPLTAVLVAAGIGFILSSLLSK